MGILCMLLLILAIFPYDLQSCNQQSCHIQEAGKTGEITVKYTVMNCLLCNYSYSYSIRLSVSRGTTLFQIMECAEDIKPDFFAFTKLNTSLGYFINGIGGVNGTTENRTYWQFLNGTVPIPVGVQQYQPSNGEDVIANFSRY